MSNKFYLKYKHLTGIDEMLLRGLNDISVDIRRSAAKNLNKNSALEVIAVALKDKDKEVRRIAGLLSVQYSKEQIESGLNDSYALIRYDFARYNFYTPSIAQVERGIRDRSPLVREAFLKRRDIEHISDVALERALKDKNPWVVVAAAERDERFTPEQIMRGLNNKNSDIRLAFASNVCMAISKVHRDAILNDVSVDVMEAYIKREDVRLNKKEAALVFSSGVLGCMFYLAMQEWFTPTDKQEKELFSHQDLWQFREEMGGLIERKVAWKAIREKQALTSYFMGGEINKKQLIQCL